MEKAVRVKGRHIGNHRRIGEKKNPSDISNGKDRKGKSDLSHCVFGP